MEEVPPELLLLVFVHGFKGTDSTFADFPQRLQHGLSESISNMKVESIIFPAYETKGELTAAVDRFADWLTTLTVEREVAHGTGGGAGKANIVLCGHSMGGLLIADTLLAMANSRPDKAAPLWPNIVSLIAFDTPYYGLNPSIFKHKLTEGIGYAQQAGKIGQSLWAIGQKFTTSSSATNASMAAPSAAQQPLAITAPTASGASSGWSKWTPAAYGIGGALVAGAAAGTAYWKKDDLGLGYKWITDHMKYVGALWEGSALEQRMRRVEAICGELGIHFHCIYTFIPAKPPDNLPARQFILLPKAKDAGNIVTDFTPNINSLAADEIAAHVGMFEARSNEAYYQLGLDAAKIVRDAVYSRRRDEPSAKAEPNIDVERSAEAPQSIPVENPQDAALMDNPWGKDDANKDLIQM